MANCADKENSICEALCKKKVPLAAAKELASVKADILAGNTVSATRITAAEALSEKYSVEIQAAKKDMGHIDYRLAA